MSLIGVGPRLAASQSTVFVTVGNSGVDFGYEPSDPIGSLGQSSVLGKSIAKIFHNSSSLQIFLTHGGTPLSQSFFRAVSVKGSNGIRTFSTSSLGSTGFFTSNAGGATGWTWKGTGIDTLPWAAGDVGQLRVVAFFR